MTNPLNTYDSEWFTVDQLSPRDFIANMEKGMNEHDKPRESPLEVIGALGVGLSILIMLALMSPFIVLGALMNRRHA